MRTKYTLYKAIAALVLAAMIGLEAYHDWVLQDPWPGFTVNSNNAGIVLVTVWGLNIIALWSKKAWAYPFLFAGPFAAFSHAMVLLVAGAVWGRFFFAGAVLSALFTFLGRSRASWGRAESSPQPGGTEEPSHRAA